MTPVCETTGANVLFGGCEQCTAASANCGAGICQQSMTPAQDDICINCVPLLSCPAGDNCGTVPDGFKMLLHHAPGAFAGYGMMRSSIMKDGALDLKTKELIFTLLDTVLGAAAGAKPA